MELPIDVSADIMEVKPFEMKFGDFTVLAEYISKKEYKRFLFFGLCRVVFIGVLGSFIGPSLFVLGHTSSRKRSIKTQLSGQGKVYHSILLYLKNRVK